MSLSDRLRPGSEAAPWVIEEVQKMEHAAAAAQSALDELSDKLEWAEKGLAEWRDEASSLRTQAEAARATARIAIRHLHAVLDSCRTHAQQQHADEAARDWLISIGSEAKDEPEFISENDRGN